MTNHSMEFLCGISDYYFLAKKGSRDKRAKVPFWCTTAQQRKSWYAGQELAELRSL